MCNSTACVWKWLNSSMASERKAGQLRRDHIHCKTYFGPPVGGLGDVFDNYSSRRSTVDHLDPFFGMVVDHSYVTYFRGTFARGSAKKDQIAGLDSFQRYFSTLLAWAAELRGMLTSYF